MDEGSFLDVHVPSEYIRHKVQSRVKAVELEGGKCRAQSPAGRESPGLDENASLSQRQFTFLSDNERLSLRFPRSIIPAREQPPMVGIMGPESPGVLNLYPTSRLNNPRFSSANIPPAYSSDRVVFPYRTALQQNYTEALSPQALRNDHLIPQPLMPNSIEPIPSTRHPHEITYSNTSGSRPSFLGPVHSQDVPNSPNKNPLGAPPPIPPRPQVLSSGNIYPSNIVPPIPPRPWQQSISNLPSGQVNLRMNDPLQILPASPQSPPIQKQPEPQLNVSEAEIPSEKVVIIPADYDNFYTPSNAEFYLASPYIRLNEKPREIRLLKVFPKKTILQHFEANQGWDSSHAKSLDGNMCLLACEIENTLLSHAAGRYSTLSYCAGDPTKTSIILVNGIPFNAFASLEHAIECVLYHWSSVHPNKAPIRLWVDQICINQSDKEERAEQVQIMRDIYRRSEETFVCMSSPKIQDCLSWVPRVFHPALDYNTHSDRYSLGVTQLKHFLLDSLVGKGQGGDLRPSGVAATTRAEVEHSQPSEAQQTPDQFQALRKRMSVISKSQRRQSTKLPRSYRSPSQFLNIDTDNIDMQSIESSLPISHTEFQNSLGAFMTNNWWRRSWVYQEFLSSTSVHFVSGPISVPWAELSPLVDFICDDLDAFLESIRVYFDSKVTEEMIAKNQKRRQRESERQAEEQRKLRDERERRKRDEQERRRRQLNEEKKRELEQERERRRIQAEREAQRAYQEQLERHKQQKKQFETAKLSQWKAAWQLQYEEQLKYEAQQKHDLNDEFRKIWSQKSRLNPVKVVDRVVLYREERELKKFRKELKKPIHEQIENARRYQENPHPDDLKADEQSGGRLFKKRRVETLLSLGRVPSDPLQYTSNTLPLPPAEPPTAPRIPNATDAIHEPLQNVREDQQYRVPSHVQSKEHHIRQARERKSATFRNQRSHDADRTSQTSKSTVHPLSLSWAVEDLADKEEPNLRSKMSLEDLDAHEVEQRERIILLQEEFRQLDRSGIVSMAKGKATFKRKSDLLPLLQHSRNCEASDSRDRVYAFLGLAHDDYGIIPDYKRINKVEMVLIETAKSIIRHDGSLAILQHVHRGDDELGVRLPSWVPDWTSKENNCGFDQYIGDPHDPFDAAKGTSAVVEFNNHPRDSLYVELKVRGIFVGKIEDIEFELAEFRDVSSFITAEGDWVIGPKSARLDDEVWVLYGAARPVALRPEGRDMFAYLGDVLVCKWDGDIEREQCV